MTVHVKLDGRWFIVEMDGAVATIIKERKVGYMGRAYDTPYWDRAHSRRGGSKTRVGRIVLEAERRAANEEN